MRKFFLCLAVVSAIAVVAAWLHMNKTTGAFIRQIVPVKPGEYVEVETEEYHSHYFFGYRLPFMSVKQRRIIGVTLHDYQNGKLIGRYHDIGVKICPHCSGVGEVNHAD